MTQRIEVPREYVRPIPITGTLSLGETVKAQFSTVEKSIAGHPVHVLGIWLRMVVVLATVANSMGAACPGEKLYNAFAKINMAFGDVVFIRSMRGAVMKQMERTLGLKSLTGAIASDLADADATPTVTLDLYIPFALPNGAPGGELDGSIPLRVFNDEDFSIELPSAGSIPHTGVSVTSITSIKAYARCMPLTKLRMPTAWTFRETRETNVVLRDEGAGFWDAGFITQFTTESDSLDMSTWTGLQFSIGSATLRTYTTAELTFLHNIRQSCATHGNGDTESVTAPEVLHVVEPVTSNPGKLFTRQPKGALKIELTARKSGVTTTDFAYRGRGTRHPAWYRVFLARVGAPASGVEAIAQGAKRKTPADLAPHFDAAISWPGMSFEG